MYVAVKGGEKAIENAHKLLAEKRRGKQEIPEITTEQIAEQMTLAVDRVMTEGSLYDRSLAALAIKQARGDLIEAIFLVRASRTTLPRFGYSEPINTSEMEIDRRISATYKDLPGGQILGPTFDYTHRLLEAETLNDDSIEPAETMRINEEELKAPHVLDLLSDEGLMEPPSRDPLSFPAGRDLRLQNLARGDEGFLLALGYSTQRGYARNHPFAAPQFTRGYGLTFGHCERKAMSMAQVDRALRADELGEDRIAPAQDEEFVLSHCDNVQATGFVEHLKLPHYVDFQSELELVRRMRREQGADLKDAAE